MKNCKNCNIEFQPKHETRGHEQLYCSIKCRNEAYKKRVNEKQTSTTAIGNESPNTIQQPGTDIYRHSSYNDSNVLNLIKEKSEAQIEAIRYQLKVEQLEKENQELKIKLSEVEMELNSLEEEEPENEMLAGIMTQYQKDPINTIRFATDILNQLFQNPKTIKNAQTTTTKG
jgi:hypothetical protein